MAPDGQEEPRVKRRKFAPPKFGMPDTLVKFIVGSEKQEFRAHEDFVSRHSPVLKVAIEHTSMTLFDDEEVVVKLEDESVAAFKHFVQYIYIGTLELKQTASQEHVTAFLESDADFALHENRGLIEAWALGAKYECPGLQNAAMEAICAITAKVEFSPTLINLAYEITEQRSMLRKFMVHMAFCDVTVEQMYWHPEYFPHRMLLDLTILSRMVRLNLAEEPDIPLDASAYFVSEEEVLE